ncbi:MAG: DJ-1/PfpI family protein [Lachnospiraceae bacterium]|nr:DJ-1/PfpI family protein [Lachnospiraceae bacterium]
MSKIAVFFATGYEEIEALTVVDLCRRAKIETEMISVTGEDSVTGSHGIAVTMDKQFEEVDFDSLDMIVLPGGMPGTKNLEAHQGLMEQLDRFYKEGRGVAAICAAPSIFGHRGYLKGRNACAYPGFESHLENAKVSENSVEVSEHVITGRGMGCAIDFGLAIVERFCGKEAAQDLAKGIIY